MALPIGPLGARTPLDLGPASPYPFVNADTPSGAPPPDGFAFVTQSRASGSYSGSYSLNSSAADERLDAYSPGQVPDSQTPLYNAPLSQTISAFAPNPTLGTDWSNVTQGNRASFSYKGSPSRTVSVFDPATNTFADWAAPPATSRPVLSYRAPPSQLAAAWTSPASSTDWAASVLSRAAQPYRAPGSQIAAVWASPVVASSTDWVAAIIQRATPFYRGSYSVVMGAADEQIDSWTAIFQGRAQPYYRAPLSATFGTLAPSAAATPDAYSPGVVRSLARDYYQAQQSFFSIGWDDHACTTLFPDTMLGPDTLLFPDLCAQLELGLVTQSRVNPFYRAPDSFIAWLADQTAAAQVAPVALSRAQQFYRAPHSLVVWVADSPVVTPDTFSAVAFSRRTLNYAPQRSVVAAALDDSGSRTIAFVVQSRAVPFFDAHGSQFIFAFDGASGVLPSEAGGGGFGADMGGRFTDRYTDRYGDRYQDRYQETFRIQRQK